MASAATEAGDSSERNKLTAPFSQRQQSSTSSNATYATFASDAEAPGGRDPADVSAAEKMAAALKMRLTFEADLREKFIETSLTHVESALTQPALLAFCDTLDKTAYPSKYKALRLYCEKVDDRSSNISEKMENIRKRLNDSWTNLITTLVAFLVITSTGILDASTESTTIITNLSPIVLNLLLSCRALYHARQEQRSLRKREDDLLKEYNHTRWDLYQYRNGYCHLPQARDDPGGERDDPGDEDARGGTGGEAGRGGGDDGAAPKERRSGEDKK